MIVDAEVHERHGLARVDEQRRRLPSAPVASRLLRRLERAEQALRERLPGRILEAVDHVGDDGLGDEQIPRRRAIVADNVSGPRVGRLTGDSERRAARPDRDQLPPCAAVVSVKRRPRGVVEARARVDELDQVEREVWVDVRLSRLRLGLSG
jgi:hypothetical protein